MSVVVIWDLCLHAFRIHPGSAPCYRVAWSLWRRLCVIIHGLAYVHIQLTLLLVSLKRTTNATEPFLAGRGSARPSKDDVHMMFLTPATMHLDITGFWGICHDPVLFGWLLHFCTVLARDAHCHRVFPSSCAASPIEGARISAKIGDKPKHIERCIHPPNSRHYGIQLEFPH